MTRARARAAPRRPGADETRRRSHDGRLLRAPNLLRGRLRDRRRGGHRCLRPRTSFGPDVGGVDIHRRGLLRRGLLLSGGRTATVRRTRRGDRRHRRRRDAGTMRSGGSPAGRADGPVEVDAQAHRIGHSRVGCGSCTRPGRHQLGDPALAERGRGTGRRRASARRRRAGAHGAGGSRLLPRTSRGGNCGFHSSRSRAISQAVTRKWPEWTMPGDRTLRRTSSSSPRPRAGSASG